MFYGFAREDSFQELDKVVLFLVGEGGAEEGEGDEVGFKPPLPFRHLPRGGRESTLLSRYWPTGIPPAPFGKGGVVVGATGFAVAAAEFVGEVFAGFGVDVADETFFVAGGTGEFF